jgi:hypothetical protein
MMYQLLGMLLHRAKQPPLSIKTITKANFTDMASAPAVQFSELMSPLVRALSLNKVV